MPDRGLLLLMFRWRAMMSIFYVILIVWWALLIVGPGRYGLGGWLVIALGPPAIYVGHLFWRAWLYGVLGKR
jgi:hypothetical protein